MEKKIARVSLIVVLMLVCLGIGAYSWLQRLGPALEDIDQARFLSETLFDLNGSRELAGSKTVQQDVELGIWLDGQLSGASGAGAVMTEGLIPRLQESLPSVAAASVFVVYGRNAAEIREKLIQWGGEADTEYTRFAARLFSSQGYRGYGCIALIAEKLPLFSPELLNGTKHSFYNRCPICSRTHLGSIKPTARSIVLECPHCTKQYDLLAVNMKGRYQRVSQFLSGMPDAPADIPECDDKLEELFAVWNAVLEHCRYQTDFQGVFGQRDSWQTSAETARYTNGDCEDTSILLADWLISRGFNARVALGKTDRLQGHAWCVVELDGRQYLLETTEAKPDITSPPDVTRVGDSYIPEFLFDRRSIYFRKTNERIQDYWSESDWLEVSSPADKESTKDNFAAAER